MLAIVKGCTDAEVVPKPPWRARKEAYVAHLPQASAQVRLVSSADKLHNARAIVADLRKHGSALWGRFTGGRESVWYYESLVEAFRKSGGGPLVDELARTVDEMRALADAPPPDRIRPNE